MLGVLTLPVVVKVEELIVPLGHDADGIFEKCNDDEESAHGREVTMAEGSMSAHCLIVAMDSISSS
jgi:hypothetical protein